MAIFSSAKQRCFISDEISPTLPEDAVEISRELHQFLLTGQAEGKVIDFLEHPPRLLEQKIVWPSFEELSSRIDDKVATIYVAWTRFEPEYAAREKAADVFRQANFEGEPGVWIKRYAEALNSSFKDAAEVILTNADQRNSALLSLADYRLRKYELQTLEGEQRHTLYQTIINQIEHTNRLLNASDISQSPPQALSDLNQATN